MCGYPHAPSQSHGMGFFTVHVSFSYYTEGIVIIKQMYMTE